jgi:hypothetical protein
VNIARDQYGFRDPFLIVGNEPEGPRLPTWAGGLPADIPEGAKVKGKDPDSGNLIYELPDGTLVESEE